VSEHEFEKRWGPLRDLIEHIGRETGRATPEGDVLWYPATDAYESETNFVIRMDLSGVHREDVNIVMKDDVVYVRGLRRDATSVGRKTYYKMEIALGPFARAVQVPKRFAGAGAQAALESGILEITLTAKKRARPVQIRIDVEEEGR
jgi:HSP20 family protein